MPGPKIQGYGKLKFSRTRAQAKLDAFCDANPNLTEEEINREIQNIVGLECLYEDRLEFMKQNDPKMFESRDYFDDISQRIENDLYVIRKQTSLKFFKEYEGERFEEIIENIQQNIPKNGSYISLVKAENGIMADFQQKVVDPQKKYKDLAAVGTHVDAGMFRPTLDSSKMPKLFHENWQEQANVWQKQSDAINIDVPEELTDDLVSFAVFGEMMKNENLEKADAIVSKKGSTLIRSVGAAETVKMSFFQNLIVDDDRINMHATRSVIPECRQTVKSMVDSGNLDGLKANIANAFNVLYLNAKGASLDKKEFVYSVTRIESLLAGLKEKNITPQEIGIEQKYLDKLPLLCAKKDLVLKHRALVAKLGSHYEGYKFTGDEAHDVLKNPELRDTVAEILTCNTIFKALSSEVLSMEQETYSYYTNNPEVIAERPLTTTEKLLLKNGEATFAAYKEHVLQGDELKTLLENAEKSQISKDALYGAPSAYEKIYGDVTLFDCEVFETKIADNFFKDLTAYANANLDTMLAKTVKAIENDDGTHKDGFEAIRESIPQIREQLARMNKIRAENKDGYTPKYAERISLEYKALSEALWPIAWSGLGTDIDQNIVTGLLKYAVSIRNFGDAIDTEAKKNQIVGKLKYKATEFEMLGHTGNVENPVMDDLISRFTSATDLPKDFAGVKDSFAMLYSALDNEGGTRDEITSVDETNIKSAFDDYFEKVNTFLETSGSQIPEELKIALRDSRIPLKTYEAGIKAGKKRSEILADTSWVSKLFAKNQKGDPVQMPEHKEPVGELFNTDFDELKDITVKAKDSYRGYLSKVCGIEGDPYKTLDYRFGLIQKIFDRVPNPNGDGNVMGNFNEAINHAVKYDEDYLSFEKNIVNNQNLLGTYFEESLSNQRVGSDISAIRTAIENTANQLQNIKKDKYAETLSQIRNALSPFKNKPENFGLDEKKMEHIAALGKGLSTAKEMINLLALQKIGWGENAVFTGFIEGLPEERRNFLREKLDRIQDKYFDYLKGNSKEPVDVDADYDELINALGDDLVNLKYYSVETVRKGEMSLDNSVYPAKALDALNILAERLPSKKEAITQLIDNAKKTINKHIQDLYPQFIDNTVEVMSKGLSEVESAYNAGFTDEKTAFKFQTEFLFDYPRGRSLAMEYLYNNLTEDIHSKGKIKEGSFYNNMLKQYLVADHFQRELQYLEPGEKQLRNPCGHARGTEITDIFKGDRASCQQALKDHIDKFLERPGIKNILNINRENLQTFLHSKNLNEILEKAAYGENLLDGISDESLSVFDEMFKNLGKLPARNSDLFTEVRKALKEINGKIHNMDDPKPEEYKRLYNACKKYTENRDPDAISDTGKTRFKAATEIYVKVALKLYDKLPDMKNDISHDLADLMSRSKDARDLVVSIRTDTMADKAKAAIEKGDQNALATCVANIMAYKNNCKAKDMLTLAKEFVKDVPEEGFKNMAEKSESFAKDFIAGVNLFTELKKAAPEKQQNAPEAENKKPEMQNNLGGK